MGWRACLLGLPLLYLAQVPLLGVGFVLVLLEFSLSYLVRRNLLMPPFFVDAVDNAFGMVCGMRRHA